jgi:hypothetical protein
MCVFQRNTNELNEEQNGVNGSRKNGVLTLENLEFSIKPNEIKDVMQLKSLEAKEKLIKDGFSETDFVYYNKGL